MNSNQVDCSTRDSRTPHRSIVHSERERGSMAEKRKAGDMTEGYVEACEELQRLRKWKASRLLQIGRERGLDAKKLGKAWCILQAVKMCRVRQAQRHVSIRDAYRGSMGCAKRERGKERDEGGGEEAEKDGAVDGAAVDGAAVREARIAVLAGVGDGLVRRERVRGLLSGCGEIHMGIREEGLYEECETDDEDAGEGKEGKVLRCVRELREAEGVEEGELREVSERVGRMAERLRGVKVGDDVFKRGREAGLSGWAGRRGHYRLHAMKWMVEIGERLDGVQKRRRRGVRRWDDVEKRSGIKLHDVAKQAVIEAFGDRDVSEGAIRAMDGVLGGWKRIWDGVQDVESERVVAWMTKSNRGMARQLVEAFGNAQTVMGLSEDEVRGVFGDDATDMMAMMHGDELVEEFKEMRRAHVVGRVIRDRFGGLANARNATFEEFVRGGGDRGGDDGGEGGVQMTGDERLAAYRVVQRGHEMESRISAVLQEAVRLESQGAAVEGAWLETGLNTDQVVRVKRRMRSCVAQRKCTT